MAARIVVRGQVYWQDHAARAQRRVLRAAVEAVPRDRTGRQLEGEDSPAHPIQPVPKAQPFRAGWPWTDPEEAVTYRVVGHVDALAGWASSSFFQARWRVGHREILQLARAGLVDAAIAEGSQVRRYRTRDEAAVLRSDPVLRAALKRVRDAQEATRDVRAQKTASSARKPRRVDGQWRF
jgi:hypothetical protein